MTITPTIRVQSEPFDAAHEIAALSQGREDVGAVVSFTGLCRADDGLIALNLEHFPGMAEEEIGRHAAQAVARWPLTGVTIIHRFGRIIPGDLIVLVVTASAHRAAAFAAADFLMDYLKTGAPFWKREEHASGSSWVEAHERDDAARARWDVS